MRKNVFLKSTVRQLARTILLAILIGIASFFFISRVVEYQIVSIETERIGGHYRSIGFFAPITPTDETGLMEVVEIISESPYFAFSNRNRYVFSSLNDIQNTELERGDGYFIDAEGTLINLRNMRDVFDIDAFFYGRLLNKRGPSFTEVPFYTLQVYVDYVVGGRPEHIAAGYEIDIHWVIKDGVQELFEQMEMGNRYFFSTSRTPMATSQNITPETGWHYLKMLNQEESLGAYPVGDSKEIDFKTHPLLSHIPADLELLWVNQHSMRVITSTDLSAMPQTQEVADEWFLLEGRWLNYEDYITENSVVVVHWLFATIRELSVGDTLALTFRDVDMYSRGAEFHETSGYSLISPMNETWREQETYESTFEIVGLFGHSRRDLVQSFMTKDLFVPDSMVPPTFGETGDISHLDFSFVLTSTRYQDIFVQRYGDTVAESGFHMHFIEHGGERFWQSAHPVLRTLSFNMLLFVGVFLGIVGLITLLYFLQRKREFAILRTLGCPSKKVVRHLYVPIFLVWLPFVLLGSAIGWVSAHNAAEATLTALAYEVEQKGGEELPEEDEEEQYQEEYVEEYEKSDGRYAEEYVEIEKEYEVRTTPSLSFGWFVGLSTLALAVPLLGIMIWVIPLTRQPALEILQGSAKKRKTGKRKKPITALSPALMELQGWEIGSITHLLTILEKKQSNKRKATCLHIKRRMTRSPVKTILVIGIACLFALAIGWLQNAIEQGDKAISRLYDTTIVGGGLRPLLPGEFNPAFPMKQVIQPRTVDALLESGFVQNVYLEAGFEFTNLILPAADGGFPDNIWEEQEFTRRDMHRLFAIDDIDTFLEVHENPTDIFGEPLEPIFSPVDPLDPDTWVSVQGETITITFTEGFDKTAFSRNTVYSFDTIVPIILRHCVAEGHGLELNDMAFLSRNFENMESWILQVQVVGIYTGMMHRHLAYNASIVPLSALEPIREVLAGGEYGDVLTGFITVQFEVDPSRNREIESFRKILEEIVNRPRAGAVHLTFDLFDGELEFVIRQMEENLHLLQLLYPMTILVALIITVGLSLLLVLQNAKNAAVMRVLGMSKRKTIQQFAAELGIVSIVGMILGMFIFALLGAGAGFDIRLTLFAIGYILMTLIGSLIGAILVCKRSTLELLQVKELTGHEMGNR